jgi:hypothetical protein
MSILELNNRISPQSLPYSLPGAQAPGTRLFDASASIVRAR